MKHTQTEDKQNTKPKQTLGCEPRRRIDSECSKERWQANSTYRV